MHQKLITFFFLSLLTFSNIAFAEDDSFQGDRHGPRMRREGPQLDADLNFTDARVIAWARSIGFSEEQLKRVQAEGITYGQFKFILDNQGHPYDEIEKKYLKATSPAIDAKAVRESLPTIALVSCPVLTRLISFVLGTDAKIPLNGQFVTHSFQKLLGIKDDFSEVLIGARKLSVGDAGRSVNSLLVDWEDIGKYATCLSSYGACGFYFSWGISSFFERVSRGKFLLIYSTSSVLFSTYLLCASYAEPIEDAIPYITFSFRQGWEGIKGLKKWYAQYEEEEARAAGEVAAGEEEQFAEQAPAVADRGDEKASAQATATQKHKKKKGRHGKRKK